MRKLIKVCFLSTCCVFWFAVLNAQTVTKQDAEKWLQGKSWSEGVSMQPSPSVNVLTFYKQYHGNKPVWTKVFEFIRDRDLASIAPGKYPIDGDNAYAIITEAPSKQEDKALWESHRNYIDLQYVIKGKERIDVANVNTAKPTNAYDATKDVTNYAATGKGYIAEPGTFYLFFPQDAHRPNIKVDGYDVVKKMVIKIKVVN